ncbi:hypothetical protein BS78_01G078400 [Paspalum vaginatum]|nr:hypothetical protein BS78_01G078400 [Paspalum vaginatum]
MGFIKGLINAFAPPPELPVPYEVRVASGELLAARAGLQEARALLSSWGLGISYAVTKYELKGAVNDINCMGLPPPLALRLPAGLHPRPHAYVRVDRIVDQTVR